MVLLILSSYFTIVSIDVIIEACVRTRLLKYEGELFPIAGSLLLCVRSKLKIVSVNIRCGLAIGRTKCGKGIGSVSSHILLWGEFLVDIRA